MAISGPLPSVSSPLDNVFADAAFLARDTYADTSAAAAARGWQPVTAADLGIPATGQFGADTYSFADGVYVAADADNSAVAHVYAGELDGQRTLAIAFRGTDEVPGDVRDHLHFITHYAHFAPLIQAIDALANDPAGVIDRVLVTGHSLGSAMVATAMIEEGWANDPQFLGVAIAAHGVDQSIAAAAPDPILNLINFGHTQDFLLLSSENGLPAISIGPSLGASSVADEADFEPKVRVGTEVWIDSGNAARLFGPDGSDILGDPVTAEHRIDGYAADIDFLAQQGELGPAALQSSPAPHFFYVGSDANDNIVQTGAGDDPSLGAAIFPARDFDQHIFARGGDDQIAGGGGNDLIDGGSGADTAVYRGAAADYALGLAGGRVSVAQTGSTVAFNDGTDTIANVEFMRFADGVRALDSATGTLGPVISTAPAAATDEITLVGIRDALTQELQDLLS